MNLSYIIKLRKHYRNFYIDYRFNHTQVLPHQYFHNHT